MLQGVIAGAGLLPGFLGGYEIETKSIIHVCRKHASAIGKLEAEIDVAQSYFDIYCGAVFKWSPKCCSSKPDFLDRSPHHPSNWRCIEVLQFYDSQSDRRWLSGNVCDNLRRRDLRRGDCNRVRLPQQPAAQNAIAFLFIEHQGLAGIKLRWSVNPIRRPL